MMTNIPEQLKNVTDRAMEAVMAGRRQAWLDCFAEDALLRDPVGGAPWDPQATGLRGHEGLGNFWDQVVAPLRAVEFEVREVQRSGRSIAKVATVRLTTTDGTQVAYPGIFVYDLNTEGRIQELRGYFELPS